MVQGGSAHCTWTAGTLTLAFLCALIRKANSMKPFLQAAFLFCLLNRAVNTKGKNYKASSSVWFSRRIYWRKTTNNCSNIRTIHMQCTLPPRPIDQTLLPIFWYPLCIDTMMKQDLKLNLICAMVLSELLLTAYCNGNSYCSMKYNMHTCVYIYMSCYDQSQHKLLPVQYTSSPSF